MDEYRIRIHRRVLIADVCERVRGITLGWRDDVYVANLSSIGVTVEAA